MPSFKDQINESLSDCKQFNNKFSWFLLSFVISLVILAGILLYYVWGGKTNDDLNYFSYVMGAICILSLMGSFICPITTIYGEMEKNKKNKIQPIG